MNSFGSNKGSKPDDGTYNGEECLIAALRVLFEIANE
jgi:hypothetical protein